MMGEQVTEAHEALLRTLAVAVGRLEEKVTANTERLEDKLTANTVATMAVAASVDKQNGRTHELEQWRIHVELAEAREAGLVAGATGLQRKQMAILIGALGIAGSVTSIVTELLARRAG